MSTDTPIARHLSWADVEAQAPGDGIERRIVHGQQLMACRYVFAPGTVTPVHRHPHEQMTLVLQGRVRFTIVGREAIASPGDVLHFPSNAEHGATMMDEQVVLVDVFTPVRDEFLPR